AGLWAAPAPRRTLPGARVGVPRVRRRPTAVSAEGWARIVGGLRRPFRGDGIAGQLGRIREWSAVGRGPRRDVVTRLALEPDGDGARVTLRRSTRDLAFAFSLTGAITTFMALLFGTLAAAGVDDELFAVAALMGAMAILFLGGLQLGLRLWANRQERRFEALLDRIELIAREDAASAGGPEALPAARAEAGPRLDLDSPAAPEPEAEPARRTRT